MLQQYQPYREGIETIKNSIAGQQLRLLEYLLCNESARTGEIANQLQIGNISKVACSLREKLEPFGLTVTATLPSPLLRNKFGKTQAHIWRLARMYC